MFFPTSLYSNLASNNVFESFKVGDNMLSLSLFLLNIIVLYVHFYSNQNMLLQRHHLFIFNDALLSPPILRENNNIFCTKHLLKYSNGCQYMQLAHPLRNECCQSGENQYPSRWQFRFVLLFPQWPDESSIRSEKN